MSSSSAAAAKDAASAKSQGKKAETPTDPEDGLTDEDRELKTQLEAAVTACASGDAAALAPALKTLRTLIKESTSSMTSVPKPLKFLAPHYETLKAAYSKLGETNASRPGYADILSVLAMVSDAAPMAEALARIAREDNQGAGRKKAAEVDADTDADAPSSSKDGGDSKSTADSDSKKASPGGGADATGNGSDAAAEAEAAEAEAASSRGVLAEAEAKCKRECLEFKLVGDPAADIGQWGHEYIRTLAGQVGREYSTVLESEDEDEDEDDEDVLAAAENSRDERIASLMNLVDAIAPYCMTHHAEAEAIDLLMETQRLPALVEGEGIKMDHPTRARVCLYLLRCSEYMGDAEDEEEALKVALALYLQNGDYADALRVALRLGHPGQVRRVLDACGPGAEGESHKLQLGYLLGRHGYTRVGYGTADADDEDEDEDGDEEDDEFAAAAATVTGNALLGRSLMSSSSGTGLTSSASASSTAAHLQALSMRGRIDDSWLPDDTRLPGSVKLSDDVKEAIGNATISVHFRTLAKELDLNKPKKPEEVFKSHLTDTGGFRPGMRGNDGAQLLSSQANIASSYVSALVNAGHGTDALLYDAGEEDGSGAAAAADGDDMFQWVHRNSADGKLAAAAALGMIHLWDHEEGPIEPQPLMEADDPHIVAGGALAIGLSCVGTATDSDVAKELLEEWVDPDASLKEKPAVVRSAALLGLGLSHAGSGRASIQTMLAPYIVDTRATWGKGYAMELACVACLSLGFVFVGTADADAASLVQTRLVEVGAVDKDHPLYRHMVLGLGLIFLGQGEAANHTLRDLDEEMDSMLAREARVLVKACAYAGTGNVLQVQEMLGWCGEHPESDFKEKKRKELEAEGEAGGTAASSEPSAASAASAAAATPTEAGATAADAADAADGGGRPRDYQYQTIAGLGLGAIAMGESLGSSMVERVTDHLLQYADTAAKRSVPLAIAMCHLSDPAYGTVDTLSKLSHDSDTPTARAAILAMGLIGAGTNNSRLAGLLRQLAVFHKRDKGSVLLIRLAQGLVAAGKGLVSISPLHSDRVLIRPAAVAAVLSLSLCALNLEGTLLGKYHHLLYTIAPALTPRMVMTLDAETREPVTLDVRIGTAVETVGQAGRPKAITGFQTHTTPALMNSHDRAEIADETWKPLCSVLEGVVLVQKQEVEDDVDGNTAREARARAAAASALARTPSQMAGIMAAASGTSDV